IEAHLPWNADLATTAKVLGISRRTLQRRLEARGLSHRELVAVARHNVVTSLLVQSSSTIEEIAIRVGFRDHTSLHRAFRRRTGTTPRTFRTGSRSADHAAGASLGK